MGQLTRYVATCGESFGGVVRWTNEVGFAGQECARIGQALDNISAFRCSFVFPFSCNGAMRGGGFLDFFFFLL